MALGSDGTVAIDTKVNPKGFNSGISSMMGALGKLAAIIGAVFAVGKIVAFGRSAVEEASKMASALIGLQSVVEGTGNSISGAQEFIKSFVADGLVPAGDAITAYKNLLLRGYDTSQIEETLLRLKDSAAFGRQGSLTMGEAIRGASEGLKNENSLLVDNAGVTKNVSKMWLDYAKSIGVAVTSLTKEQRILAEVQGIQEETRFQTGDAAKAAGTYAGQVSALTTAFLMMKVALGNILMPILAQIIPYIRAIIDALTVYFNRIALLVQIFFGVDIASSAAAGGVDAVTASTEAATTAQDDLASSTEDTAKAAKGALAAFDQLNVLAQDSAAGGAGGPAAGATPGGGGLPGLDKPKDVDAGLEAIRKKVERFKADLLILLEPAIAAFKRLQIALEPLGKTLLAGLAWVWENILVPFGKWALTTLLPAFFDLMAASALLLNAALIVLKPVFKWLWENILLPLAQATGLLIIDSIKGWTLAFTELGTWLENHPDLFKDFGHGGIAAWEAIQAKWAEAGDWFIVNVLAPLFIIFNQVKENIKLALLTALTNIKTSWAGAGVWFILNVTDRIRNGFATLVAWLPGAFRSAFTQVVETAKSSVNGIIAVINGMLQGMANAINRLGDMLRNFRIDIPAIPIFGFPGFSFSPGYIPHVSAGSIPYLATGAVIPPNAKFAAILGDQKSGTNIEAPANLIRQILREELGTIKADIDIQFTGSLSSLARELQPVITRESVRLGKSLVK